MESINSYKDLTLLISTGEKVKKELEDSKLEGYKKIVSYYGSSCYDVREMCVLINEIVAQCKELGIETISKNELERMKSAWGR